MGPGARYENKLAAARSESKHEDAPPGGAPQASDKLEVEADRSVPRTNTIFATVNQAMYFHSI